MRNPRSVRLRLVVVPDVNRIEFPRLRKIETDPRRRRWQAGGWRWLGAGRSVLCHMVWRRAVVIVEHRSACPIRPPDAARPAPSSHSLEAVTVIALAGISSSIHAARTGGAAIIASGSNSARKMRTPVFIVISFFIAFAFSLNRIGAPDADGRPPPVWAGFHPNLFQLEAGRSECGELAGERTAGDFQGVACRFAAQIHRHSAGRAEIGGEFHRQRTGLAGLFPDAQQCPLTVGIGAKMGHQHAAARQAQSGFDHRQFSTRAVIVSGQQRCARFPSRRDEVFLRVVAANRPEAQAGIPRDLPARAGNLCSTGCCERFTKTRARLGVSCNENFHSPGSSRLTSGESSGQRPTPYRHGR